MRSRVYIYDCACPTELFFFTVIIQNCDPFFQYYCNFIIFKVIYLNIHIGFFYYLYFLTGVQELLVFLKIIVCLFIH